LKQLLKTVKESSCNMQHKYFDGRIAQRESTSLTSKGSLVQSQLRPPFKLKLVLTFLYSY
jgi:hypothetical protein